MLSRYTENPPENAIFPPAALRVSAVVFSYTENSSFRYTRVSTGNLLIDQLGEGALIFAAQQADGCLEAGDLDGNTITMAVGFGYYRRGFEGYLGNVGYTCSYSRRTAT